jgi:hypothetical protein
MITTIFMTIVWGALVVITLPLQLLPNAALPAQIGASFSELGGYISPLSAILPVATIFAIFGVFLGIELGIVSFRIILWLIRRIPTQS